MASVVLTQAVNTGFGTSPQNATITEPSAGNTLVILVPYVNSGGTPLDSFSDNQGNSYTLDKDFGATERKFYRCQSVAAGTTTITATWSGGGSAQATFYVYEVSGLDSSPVGQTPDLSTGFGTSREISVTTATANEVAVAFLNLSSGREITPSGGMTADPTPSAATQRYRLYHSDLGAAGSKTLGASWTTEDTATLYLIAYKSAAGGGGAGGSFLIVL